MIPPLMSPMSPILAWREDGRSAVRCRSWHFHQRFSSRRIAEPPAFQTTICRSPEAGGAIRKPHAPLAHWRSRAAYPKVLETARNTSKAAAEVARCCEFCFDRPPRAVGSGQRAGSIGRAANAVGYEDLRVLAVWGANKHHAEVDQRDERRQDRRLLAAVDGGGARENAGGLVLELAFEPEATRGVHELLHLRAHVAIAGRRPPGDAVGPA